MSYLTDDEIDRLDAQVRAERRERKSARMRERMKALHADPEFKAKMKAVARRRRLNVPDDLKALYSKLRSVLGVAAARAELRRLVSEAA